MQINLPKMRCEDVGYFVMSQERFQCAFVNTVMNELYIIYTVHFDY